MGLAAIGNVAAKAEGPSSPLSPEQALKGIKTDPDLKVELAAAEPDVLDPVFVAFDPKGRMWVVQMADYPNGPAPGEPGKSSIRVLTDADGDGRYTNPVVFANGLLFANTLMFWQDGVLVTTDGRLDFMADRDGDGKAEFRETWFEGFSRENPQLRANSPTLGHDGLIYVANGLRGGKIKAVRKEWGEHAPVDISSRDFCFGPFTGEARATSGHGQYGMSFDNYSRRFCCSNRNPCIQVVLPEWAIEKNRDVAVTTVVADAAASGEASRIYPVSRFWTTSNLHAGQFTAACGLHLYRGDGLGSSYYGNAFTCDPTGNLIHREVLEGDGVVFKGRSPYEGREFLASEDTWFRPVNLATGPDGALYIADMYRAVIEHPQFMPDELKNRPDLLLGTDRGRVYRVVNRAAGRKEPTPALHEQSSAELVAFLDHPNVWQRETAFRLLMERQDRTAATALIPRLKEQGTPQGTCLALWTLLGLKALSEENLTAVAQASRDPNVLEECLRVARLLAVQTNGTTAANVAGRIVEHSPRMSPRLLFQVVLNLPADKLLAASQLLRGQLDDPWIETATLLSSQTELVPFASEVVASLDQRDVQGAIDFVGRAMQVVGSRGDVKDLPGALKIVETLAKARPENALEVRSQLWPRLSSALKAKGRNPSMIRVAAASVGIDIERILKEASRTAADAKAEVGQRIAALRLLELESFDQAAPAIAECLKSPESSVAAVAIAAAGVQTDARVVPMLLENYSARSPALRREILAALFRSEARIAALFDEIDAGRIAPTEIDPIRMQQLGRVKNPELKERAAKLIAANRPADRTEVLERYQPALSRKGDPVHGRELFSKNCAQCHRIGTIGVNVAPDISDSRVKLPNQLLTDILDPNRAIDNNYFNYLVIDRDGTIYNGIIATETSTSITLRQAEDKRVTLARENIEQIKSTGQSLMPVGLEKVLTVEDMSDLISFIKNWRYLDGEVPKEVIR